MGNNDYKYVRNIYTFLYFDISYFIPHNYNVDKNVYVKNFVNIYIDFVDEPKILLLLLLTVSDVFGLLFKLLLFKLLLLLLFKLLILFYLAKYLIAHFLPTSIRYLLSI